MNHAPLLNPKPRLLIIDDERLNVMALSAILREEFELLVALDGPQGLSIAAAERPDLILLDVLMPGMNGHEVCHALRAEASTQKIPIIFITGRSTAEDETLGFELGAVDYITKPFNLAVVVARVRTHVRLKQQGDLLERLVLVDALTGIANRRAFEQAREREWARCRRAGMPLSLLMMDVDHFKSYNDHYGHSAGDACLARVAQALGGCARRPADFVGRYGGEEFVALLPELDAAGAEEQGRRFLAAVTALELPHAHSSAGPLVSLSIGVATSVPAEGQSPAALQERADRLLYDAKQAGRNRVMVSSL